MKTGKIELLAFIMILFMGVGLFAVKSQDEISAFLSPDQKPIQPVFVIPEIEARSAYVYDIAAEKVLFAKDAEKAMPLASITKLMTALTAYESLPSTAIVTIQTEDLKIEGDSGLLAYEKWRLKDLMDFTLIVSSNDGASALASISAARSTLATSTSPKSSFIAKMNSNAQKIGMHQSFFFNESGLDVSSSTAGAYASAQDVAKLFEYILGNYPEILEGTRYSKTSFTSLDQFIHPAKNTNLAADALPGLIGSKTGTTELAGGNLVVGFDAGFGRPIVIAVLGSSIAGRFDDVQKLASSTLHFLAQ